MTKRICLVCNTEYEYCSKCDRNKTPQRWKNTYCCENCKGIYGVVNKYVFGHMNKNTAKAALKKYDLSNKKSFNSDIKGVLNEILKKDNVEEDN